MKHCLESGGKRFQRSRNAGKSSAIFKWSSSFIGLPNGNATIFCCVKKIEVRDKLYFHGCQYSISEMGIPGAK